MIHAQTILKAVPQAGMPPSRASVDVDRFCSTSRFRGRTASDIVETGDAVSQRQFHYGSRPMPTFFGPSRSAYILALSSALTLSAMPAKAADNSFSIPTQATTAQGGATGGVAIGLPPAGAPTFFMNFVLPRDYAKNQKISVVLYLSSPAAPCIVRIVTPQIVRFRRNSPVGFDLAGLDEGNPNIKIGDDLIAQKIITIGPGDQLNGQRAGDAFSIQFRREADDNIDTCNGNVFVQAIDVRYPI